MLQLKPFYLHHYKNALQHFDALYISDMRIGVISANYFGRKNSPLPYQFRWVVDLGFPDKIIYGESVEDCKEKAIELFRIFLFRIMV